jgi:dienelactone hydrolase
MNHGKQPGDPRDQGRDRFLYLSKEFVRRGYAVIIPMRSGFAHSGGEYTDYGCNMTANGYLQANDIHAALDWARRQSWVDAEHVLIAGQSYGGLATMAAGAAELPGVRGLINFAGGLRSDDNSCAWQAGLEAAFTNYGAHSQLPSLWFYGQNDSYFRPALATRLHDLYVGAGGKAELVVYGPFKRDAHGTAGSRDGFSVWWPETRKFLESVGMPTEETVAIADEAPPADSKFAALDNVDAIPYLRDGGREAYRAFLGKETPRAFAVSSSGAWSWAEEGEDPVRRAMAACQKSSHTPCRLYAVDDHVVWNDAAPVPANLADATPAASERPLAPAAPTLPLQGE